jgi:hypothetical protein
MKSCWTAFLFCTGLASLIPAVEAAPKKAVRNVAVRKAAKPAVAPPKLEAIPIIPGGFMVPRAVVLRPTTPQELEANSIWNLRAALNVAALQCQFSRYLGTVKNYNDFLKQHGDELVRAQGVMLSHFRRYDRNRAASSFDQYTTRTYNSFSTLDAQYKFCDAAGLVGREVLTLPKNGLGKQARQRSTEIRSALEYQPLSPALAINALQPLAIPTILIDG